MTDNETPPNVLPGDLDALWAAQDETVRIADEAELINSLRATHRRENKILGWLNIQEVVPALALAVFYLWLASDVDSRQWSLLAAAACALALGAFLVLSTVQQRVAERAFSTSMRGELQRSLSQAHHRAWLYRNIGWWYLAPIAIGLGLARYGVIGGRLEIGDVVFGPLFAAGLVGLWWFNRRIGRNRYEPEVDRYRGLLAELDG